jgi:2-polyprenyl-6-methoxyphenol hydroxylase-like FAD-dependent oxidoreductase
VVNPKRDIAICGCGPAGLAAALLLHRSGNRVRIFERFATPRAVGSGLILQPTGLAVLGELGLAAGISKLGARIDRLFGRVAPSDRVVLDVRYASLGAGWHGIAVHRSALFDLLHEAAIARGIEIVSGVCIDAVGTRSNGATLLGNERQLLGEFDLIVDAMGSNSPLAAAQARRTALPYGALWTNIAWPAGDRFRVDALEQRYFRAQRMAGILPIGRLQNDPAPLAAFFWSLKCEDLEAWRSAWRADVARVWPRAAPLLEAITDMDQLTFARYAHFTLPTPFSGNVVHIGDAARATSPQLGQGANMALLDALALARALPQSANLNACLESFARMRRLHTRIFQWASAAFTPFYQSDSRVLPWLRDWLAGPLSRLPIADVLLARLVAGVLVAPMRNASFQPLRMGANLRRY